MGGYFGGKGMKKVSQKLLEYVRVTRLRPRPQYIHAGLYTMNKVAIKGLDRDIFQGDTALVRA